MDHAYNRIIELQKEPLNKVRELQEHTYRTQLFMTRTKLNLYLYSIVYHEMDPELSKFADKYLSYRPSRLDRILQGLTDALKKTYKRRPPSDKEQKQ